MPTRKQRILKKRTRFDGNGFRVIVINKEDPISIEESRILFPYRPFSAFAETPFKLEDIDDVLLILNGRAMRCRGCYSATSLEYLLNGKCPDCDGRSTWLYRCNPYLPATIWHKNFQGIPKARS